MRAICSNTCQGVGGGMVSDCDRQASVRDHYVFSVAFPVSSFPLPTLL